MEEKEVMLMRDRKGSIRSEGLEGRKGRGIIIIF